MSMPDNAHDQLPPNSEEAERAVLACCIIDPAASVGVVAEKLKGPDAFYDTRHQLLWTAIASLSDEVEHIDEITVLERLRTAGTLETAGGSEYLFGLRDAVTSPSALEYYVGIVHEKMVLRHALKTCAEVRSKIYSHEGSVNDLLEHIDTRMLELSLRRTGANEITIREVMHRVVTRMEDYHRGRAQMVGLSTGIDYLDKMTSGIAPGQMWVLAGRPGGGKTSLGMNIVEHIAVNCQVPTAVFSLEMTADELGQRLLFARARADMQRFRTGFLEEREIPSLTKAAGEIAAAPLCIDDDGAMTIADIRAKARRLHHQRGIKLVLIDYVQLIRGNTRYHSRLDEVADISHQLKALAKELQIPVVILAQMNREMEKDGGKRLPRLSDLRECGDIEQDADLVGLLYKPKPKERSAKDEQGREYTVDEADEWSRADWSRHSERVNLLIGKQRNGPTGDVELLFRKASMRFDGYVRTYTAPPPDTGDQDRYDRQLDADYV